MSDKIKIIVDEKEIEVNKQERILEALAKHNINIPHFCYHPELGVDGNCRMCLVEIKGKKRPQIACDTPVSEGMHICTKSPLTKKVQRSVMELELLNHPIDCPTCDQAGECYLQEYYMKHDLASSRLSTPKVKKEKSLNYGAGVLHDQERCILCTRCVRFTKNITKTNELGVDKRGNESRIVVLPGRPINNRYAQCIVDVCPVGAMLSEDFRFKKRVWHLKTAKSICHSCSKACNVYIDYDKPKYEEEKIYRFRPRRNDNVNGHFMCDEGRYSYKLENAKRLKYSLIEGAHQQLPDALSKVISKLELYQDNLIFLISPNLSLEEMYLIKKLAKFYGAKLNAYTSYLYKEGDGDDYLIQDDKASNRASLKILDIDESLEGFTEGVRNSELLVLFNNKEIEFINKELINNKFIINISAFDNDIVKLSNYNIPCTSYSDTQGIYINCDLLVQKTEVAISKLVPNIYELVNVFSLDELTKDLFDIREELSLNLSSLKEIDLNNISYEGESLKEYISAEL